ncbi:MAG TPA: DMT family transporter [Gaiellaceae bacterium]|nr:DMT family transporter [Gaiellaceae bacterium]
MTRRQILMLLTLSAIWGSSFMFIKVGVRQLEPSTLVAGRLFLAALTLVVIVKARMPLRTAVAQVRAQLRPFLVVALLNSVVPFWLLAWGETRIDSGLAALLQACAPLFTAVLAALFVRSERVEGRRLVGVMVGFGGVALLVGAVSGGSILGALAVVLAGLCYAASSLVGGRYLTGLPATTIAFGTTSLATIVALPIGLAQLPGSVPGWKVIGSVLALGIVGLGVAYILYFGLITGAGASRAILVTYLVPPMALFYGATVLNEGLKATDLAGLALILTGVALGTGVVQARRRPVVEPA